ncbi:MAG: Integral membrane component of other binding-protein-dependent transport system, partial [uncultured bacterium]
IILGTIPILVIFLVWIYTTTGVSQDITLPDGIFENWEHVAPPDGTWFKDRVRFTVPDSTLTYGEDEIGRQVTWLEKNGERFPLTNIPARVFEKSVRITLPPGKIIEREKLKPDMVDLQPEKPTIPQAPTQPGSGTDTNKGSEAVPKPDAEIPLNKTSVQPGQTPSETPVSPAKEPVADKPVDSSLPAPAKNTSDKLIKITYRYEVVETRKFPPVIIPSPGEVFGSLPALWSQRNLPLNMLYSFMRVGAGFLVAFIVAFPMALLMGTFSKLKSLFSPLMLFGGYLPIPALVPLTMILFGTTEQQKIMFLALGFTIYLLPLFVKALEEVDNVYLQTGYTLGARKYDVLNRILLPIALPNMFDAMRIGFGVGWGYIILAEMVDMGSFGVGTLILTSQRRGPREDIYLVLIAIVVLAFITDKIWDKVDRELFPYRRQER